MAEPNTQPGSIPEAIDALNQCVCDNKSAIGDVQTKLDEATQTVYRYKPAETPGLRNRWWDNTAGPHLDPLEWSGPADSPSGFPLPTAAAPLYDSVSNSTNIRDNPDGASGFAARYGIIDGWIFLPDDVTHLRDNNANTGEYGMVLLGGCCGGSLVEQPGGNHTVNTNGQDRTLMDSTPITGGWHYIYNPQSDSGAFQGLDLEYSTDNEASWQEVTVMRPTAPEVECDEIPFCDSIPEGWQRKFIEDCCQPTWSTGGEGGLDEAAVQALIDATPHPDQEICTGDFVDVSSRTGWLHTWTPAYTANSGTVIDGWNQVGTAEVAPNCQTDITVNVALGNYYYTLENMWGRSWYDVRLLVNGTAVLTYTFQNYAYDDDRSTTNTNRDNDIRPLGSAHLSRANVPAGATITVEIQRRHSFAVGPAAGEPPYGRLISGLRAHFNVHYSPTQIVTGRV